MSIVVAGNSFLNNRPKEDAPSIEAISPEGYESNTSSSGSIAIPGYEKLVMKADQVEQIANLYNPAENNCYFQISISLADGEELYKTGMIAPGQEIEQIEINRSLVAGVYEAASLRYDCYSVETMQPLNGSEAILNLEVLK